MIHEQMSYTATCDNCGDQYVDAHSGFSIFADDDALISSMDSDEWYTGYGDEDHDGKYYCPECFTHHPEIDDKIVIDESRKKKPN